MMRKTGNSPPAAPGNRGSLRQGEEQFADLRGASALDGFAKRWGKGESRGGNGMRKGYVNREGMSALRVGASAVCPAHGLADPLT